MRTIANLLRQERERQGLSLQEVERRTRLPLRYLEVLEGKEEKVLLADPLYLLPLLRTYADFLGLDSTYFLSAFITETLGNQHQPLHLVNAKHGQDLLAPPPQRSRTFSLTAVLISVLVTLAIIGQLSSTGSQQSGERGRVPLSTYSFSPPTSQPVSPPPSAPELSSGHEGNIPSFGSTPAPPPKPLTPSLSSEGATPQVKASQITPLTQSPSPTEKGVHVLRVQAKEVAWIRMTVAGQPSKDFLLQPGQTIEWTSPTEFVLTLGNAGGVDLIVDGRTVSPLGKSGQVIRNIRLPVQG
jgi:cytoskeleton protein RodZ